MKDYLQLKKLNCKNCYKCIRHCPVKSIKFSDNQANIIADECILCGTCFVVCPQNAKQIRNDIHKVKDAIKSGKKVVASIAPSFAANYSGVNITSMEKALKKLGFCIAEETAVGAQIVTGEYEKMVNEGNKSIIISSCCNSVNTLIQKYFPTALKYLADVLSPMQAHCKKLKDDYPDCYTVFIGPCISKKEEAEKYAGLVNTVLTFEELSEWMEQENVTFESVEEDNDDKFTPTIDSDSGEIGTGSNYSGGQQGIRIPGYPSITVDAGKDNVTMNLFNPEGNPCYFTFEIVLSDTGETIYKSDMVEPGKAITNVKLQHPLATGEHNAVIKISTASLTDGKTMNGANVETVLVAK